MAWVIVINVLTGFILCGVGGAGLFSDGKLNYIHKLGKTRENPKGILQSIPTGDLAALLAGVVWERSWVLRASRPWW